MRTLTSTFQTKTTLSSPVTVVMATVALGGLVPLLYMVHKSGERVLVRWAPAEMRNSAAEIDGKELD